MQIIKGLHQDILGNYDRSTDRPASQPADIHEGSAYGKVKLPLKELLVISAFDAYHITPIE